MLNKTIQFMGFLEMRDQLDVFHKSSYLTIRRNVPKELLL